MVPDPEQKICRDCETPKSTDEFSKDCSKKDGLRAVCKECHNMKRRLKRQQSPEKYRKYSREYLRKNPDKARIYNRRNYYRHHEKRKAYEKARRGKDGWDLKHKEYMRNYSRERWVNMTEEEKAESREYQREWKRNNPSHREKANLRRRTTPRGRLGTIRQNARRKNIPFDLSFEEFLSFWQEPCVYCGGLLDTVGIDRVDSTLGYSLQNCVSCCKTCNFMKGTHSTEFWISHMRKILSHTGD